MPWNPIAGPVALRVNLQEDGRGWKPIHPLAVTLTATAGEKCAGA